MVTKSQNMRNLNSYGGIAVEYFDEMPDSNCCIELLTYGKHNFDNYWINVETIELYYYISNQYRKVNLNKL